MIRLIGTTQNDDEVLLYYAYTKSGKNFFKVIRSSDGFEFNGNTKYVIVTDAKGREEPKYEWQRFTISQQDKQFVVTYKGTAKSYPNLNSAVSTDLLRWTKIGKIETIKETGAVVPNFKYKHRHVLYFGEKDIRMAYSSQFEKWKPLDKPILESRKDFFDDGDLEVANVYQLENNILLLYYAKSQYKDQTLYKVGAAFLDKKNPENVIWRSDTPLWEQPNNLLAEPLNPLGAAILKNQLILYWIVRESTIYAVSCPIPPDKLHIKDKHPNVILNKHHANPIINPRPEINWDSRASFNSAALYDDGKVHFLYRALGDKDLSVLGYATSTDGFTIDERSAEPCYFPREPFETPGGHAFKKFADHYVSGGGYGGIEDPRITRVGEMIYLTYVAFDGATPPRAAMSSISVDDFRKKNWENWSKAKLISAPGMVNKSAVVLPEKINGKYVVMHRVYPNILVDYLDDMEFNTYLRGDHFIPPRKNHWDSKKVGAGAPPMRTKDGWLLIYQSVGHQDPSRYKIGAMILDANHPEKVLYRSNKPLIAPDEHYENAGHKAGVVYPCGAVIKDGKLLVYYGGADTNVCAASQDLDTFLAQMKYNQEPKLKKVHAPMLN